MCGPYIQFVPEYIMFTIQYYTVNILCIVKSVVGSDHPLPPSGRPLSSHWPPPNHLLSRCIVWEDRSIDFRAMLSTSGDQFSLIIT
jgi:hypothetical protein